ncbi:AbrB/MazE/SpoVT family DNA-binding domain-containing protein [Trueperella pyogenes]|uniref:AbrB/MazE/SpoVT family DNA-binding domain-containing protein n=1 Tax=Trueperella pyogenes TaxID=1661 RepID=UPI000F854B08|nr:AbrB/MazE/SpoVT family DNA-binding domain-containing protein [Trueperella pyogenes]AZR02750.1 AbrB/MazE/SpoVT family DNA-binding domain-containing protein [Trueperella pyogenes]UVJ53945.1 AbrB/MazE/SpoVT family DNA-binding domain-containing protein [Trueperella pyogenes]WHU58651.1 AbrB/MazE/SpoVT family DNA-binding domain-containing protein [Trueperella pyogenes]
MLVELKAKSQMTIPKQIMSELGLSIGDQFEAVVQDGNIVLIPVVVYPKARIEELNRLADEARTELQSGTSRKFSNVEDLISFLHDDVDS